jgi:hypothetical protein
MKQMAKLIAVDVQYPDDVSGHDIPIGSSIAQALA